MSTRGKVLRIHIWFLPLLWVLATHARTANSEGEAMPAWPTVSAHRQGLELLNRGVLFEAARLLKQHVTAHPEDWAARFDLATVYFRLGRDREAVEELLVLRRNRPDHVRARRLLVRIRMRLGHNLDWENPADVLEFARLCTRMENYDRARACYALLLRDDPDPALRLEFATMLSWAQRHEEALAQFAAYLEEEPGDAEARHRYARVMIARGDIADAEVQLREALRLDPESTEFRLDHARTLVWLDRDEEAEEQLRRIIARDADLTEPRILLADMHLNRDRVERAYALYQEALRIDPDEARARRKIRELEETLRIDLARLRRRLREDPFRHEDRRQFLELLVEQGRTGEAIRELERWAGLDDEDAEIRSQIRMLREKQREGVRRVVEDRRSSGRLAAGSSREEVEAWLRRHADDGRARAKLEGGPLQEPKPAEGGR